MNLKTNIANSGNYTRGRTRSIKYIIIHYTANNGDTAKGNCNYFAIGGRNASAHYFVDENGIYQSVADSDTAWSVGASRYFHDDCRNNNSISVEMCSRKDSSGNYYIKEDTVSNAAELVKVLMEKYNVPISNVLRHYDVTGKNCPEPFVRDATQWTVFKKRLEEEEMEKTAVKISVNGTAKTLEGFNIDGTNYVTIRELCELLGVTVGYDSATKTVVLSK
ncbi:MAG TPA: N-acetylmuramoyl-L-alanine amidase [Lachnospiraceae bacterium]|nr:N-acetylmuramoyl-L-alanine amidase [Lachnospiraceae bacterium]